MNDKPQQQEKLKNLFASFLDTVGEDKTREGLVKTPERAAKAYSYLTEGYTMDIDKVVNGALFESESDEMIIVKGIELYSMCEHHLLPIIGECHVGYIPDGQIIGLSKVARLVNVFARRLQVQERLTRQIGEAILKYTNAKGVGVVIDAKHLCMMARGVEKQQATMRTSYVVGVFREKHDTRAEFFSLIKD